MLAFDTSGAVFTLALVEIGPSGHRCLITRTGDGISSHSAKLPPLVQQVLLDANLRPKSLDLIACGTGPGSFTGLRTSLSMAKGLALGLGRPVVGVDSLTVLASSAGDCQYVAPVIDARHREVFTRLFRHNPNLTEPEPLTDIIVASPEKISDIFLPLVPAHSRVCLTGPAVDLVGPLLAPFEVYQTEPPSSETLAKLAYGRYLAGDYPLNLGPPIYIRSPDIFKTWTPPARLAKETGGGGIDKA
ncbi:MAG: tRNA (adenosine(37)-N6)-threonylcarbamoyltransferase complex dimerization subunit type 1 TsaB [Deltaproteobacteria bacterium]|nr:tRNA (adenosine(37)-N6)-threonylcarbamoyltransferase complex dimerization subunit type 1 TsaB [Deltaproteobacteria bacterium]